MRFFQWALIAILLPQAVAWSGPEGSTHAELECTRLRLDRELTLNSVANIPIHTTELIRQSEPVPGYGVVRKLSFPLEAGQRVVGQPDVREIRAMLREAYLTRYLADQRIRDSEEFDLRPRYMTIYMAENWVETQGDGHSLVYGRPPIGTKGSRKMCVDAIGHDPVRNTFSVGEAKGRDILHAIHQIFATVDAKKYDGTRWIRGLSQLDELVIVTCEREAFPKYYSINSEGNLMTAYLGEWVEVRIFEEAPGKYGIFPPQLAHGFNFRTEPPFALPPPASQPSRPIRILFTLGHVD